MRACVYVGVCDVSVGLLRCVCVFVLSKLLTNPALAALYSCVLRARA